eukprot:1178970-Prorocentrum_minimum.AAC.1
MLASRLAPRGGLFVLGDDDYTEYDDDDDNDDDYGVGFSPRVTISRMCTPLSMPACDGGPRPIAQ